MNGTVDEAVDGIGDEACCGSEGLFGTLFELNNTTLLLDILLLDKEDGGDGGGGGGLDINELWREKREKEREMGENEFWRRGIRLWGKSGRNFLVVFPYFLVIL